MRKYILLPLMTLISVGGFANPVEQIIKFVKETNAPDKRQTVFEVTYDSIGPARYTVSGKVSDRVNYEKLMSELAQLDGIHITDSITLLPDDQWGQINVSVACMRTSGKYSAEMATQAIMGMPVRLLEENDGWWRIQTPDGYLGWVWRASIAKKSPEQLEAWRKADRLVVTSLFQIPAYSNANTISPRQLVTDLVPGVIVEGPIGQKVNGRVNVMLPDGRKVWADASAFTPIEEWAAQDFNADVILDQAYALEGAPYLWGGTSTKSTDCSGLVKVCYLANGLILRRDASQQILTGTHLQPENWRDYKAGDLLFFGEKPGGRATHVAIYDSDGMFIHCAGNVHRNSIDPESPDYVNRTYFLGASRISGNEGTEGITYARNHPWYFDK